MSESKGGIVPEGDSIRRALRWLADRRREEPSAPRGGLIDEVALRFDLTPLEVQFLVDQWKE